MQCRDYDLCAARWAVMAAMILVNDLDTDARLFRLRFLRRQYLDPRPATLPLRFWKGIPFDPFGHRAGA